MTIRFLQTCASENPDYPFMGGQEFTFTGPPPPIFAQYLDGVQACVVRADPTELAVEPEPETAEPVRAKVRRRKRR